jgi:hypothetical protein
VAEFGSPPDRDRDLCKGYIEIGGSIFPIRPWVSAGGGAEQTWWYHVIVVMEHVPLESRGLERGWSQTHPRWLLRLRQVRQAHEFVASTTQGSIWQWDEVGICICKQELELVSPWMMDLKHRDSTITANIKLLTKHIHTCEFPLFGQSRDLSMQTRTSTSISLDHALE